MMIPAEAYEPPSEAQRLPLTHRSSSYTEALPETPDDAPPLSPNEETFTDEIFDTFRRNPVVLLLAQDDREDRAVFEAILGRARHLGQTLDVTLLRGLEATSDQYFTSIARKCGFDEGVDGPIGWQDALDYRLSSGEPIFLLMNGFESGSADARRQLGTILHALTQKHRPNLLVVLSGGEGLAALKYEADYLSVLWSAERLDWPEPNAEDVLAWQRREYPRLDLGKDEAEAVRELCGGHPRFVRYCLGKDLQGESAREALADYDAVWQLFTYYRDDTDRKRLRDWLEKDDLGPAQAWIGDSLLRRLYWTNALTRRGRQLEWRCDLVRDVGRRVLG